jgi:hypothetical protein
MGGCHVFEGRGGAVLSLFVTALPLDVTPLHMVLWVPTTVKVGHVSIVTVKLLIITL